PSTGPAERHGCAGRRRRLDCGRCAWPSCRRARCSPTRHPATTRRATACPPRPASGSRAPSLVGPGTPCSTWARPSSPRRSPHPSGHAVGKVCLHLAENRGDEEHPFAFLATYAARASAGGKVQHRPLARALEESSARGDRQALLHLLVPLQRAAEQTKWLAELIDSGAIYEAMAWTPAEAHRFLRAIPAFEAAGLVVRVPDWWRPRRPPRPAATVPAR